MTTAPSRATATEANAGAPSATRQMERLLAEKGRELLRSMMQAHYDETVFFREQGGMPQAAQLRFSAPPQLAAEPPASLAAQVVALVQERQAQVTPGGGFWFF